MTEGTAGVSGTVPWFSTTGAVGCVLLLGLFLCDERFFLGVVFLDGFVVVAAVADVGVLAAGDTDAAPAVEVNPVGRVDPVVVAVPVAMFDTSIEVTAALAVAAATFGAAAAV